MKIKVSNEKIEKIKAEALVLTFFEKEKLSGKIKAFDKVLGNLIQNFLKAKDFKAELNEVFMFPTYGRIPAKRVMLVGLGKKKEFNSDKLRQAVGSAANYARGSGLKSFCALLPESKNSEETSQTITEGILLGLYQFTEFKTEDKKKIKEKEIKNVLILCSQKDAGKVKKGIGLGEIIAESTNYTRTLSNEPANIATPTMLANRAKEIAKEFNLKIKILNQSEAKKLGMNAFLAVGQGSVHEPKFIVLEYNSGKKNTVALIGKSITFDAGGIDTKPWRKMDEMKFDMAGGAAVLGTMRAVAKLKLPIHVVGILPAAENLPSGSAYRPGDILKTYSGKTIEVINTDAEGRLTLADALSYSLKYKPKVIIDLATLTGACVVALGTHAAAMLGNNPNMLKKVKKAGEKTFERVWELPLWKEYLEQMKSDVADVKNLDPKGEGGTITAASLLSKFVDKTPWVHLDIAGTGWTEDPKPYCSKGATGYGVRLLVQFLRDFCKK